VPVLKPVRGIRLNKSHPLARGLVGYWLLNEGSGNKVFDLSGNGKTGTINGTITWVADYLNCPGSTGNNISIPVNVITINGDMTIFVIAKVSSGAAVLNLSFFPVEILVILHRLSDNLTLPVMVTPDLLNGMMQVI